MNVSDQILQILKNAGVSQIWRVTVGNGAFSLCMNDFITEFDGRYQGALS
ncbi:MAG TPA: hypothetical protein VKX40_09300 [Aequorivita sp.]|nr:hypothetical protein [Aequorivita sp.]